MDYNRFFVTQPNLLVFYPNSNPLFESPILTKVVEVPVAFKNTFLAGIEVTV